MEDRLLEFHSVSVEFQEKLVIDQLSFSLKRGEVIALLGPSGCGKTTILNITSGLHKQSNGTVEVGTEEFGYVFQEPRLIPWKTVLENVLFVMKEKVKGKKLNKAHHVLEKVGLSKFHNYYPSQLSGGMKQRVSIARALASDPKIILMDEPFSALDPKLKGELQDDVIKLIEDSNVSIMYVTHDPLEAVKLADRVLVFGCEGCSLQYEIKLPLSRRKRDYSFLSQFEFQIRKCLGGLNNAKSS